jgi:hypothetical protein
MLARTNREDSAMRIRWVVCGALLALAALISTPAAAYKNVVTLLNAVTTTATGNATADLSCPGDYACPITFTCSETVSSGAGTATVVIEGANDAAGAKWITLVTTTTLTDLIRDGGVNPYGKYTVYRARVTAIAGTGAAVTCWGVI